MLKEFREFAMKGNVVDLAIGVIIGAAFGRIVESLVGDMIMPVFGAITGGPRFLQLFPSAVEVGDGGPARRGPASRAPCWPGATSSPSLINFTIVAFALFFVVKGINRAQEEAQKKSPRPRPRPGRKCCWKKSAICCKAK